MRLSNRIVIATTNRNKFEEFVELYKPWPEIELVPAEAVLRNPRSIGFAERHDSYLENAVAKARLVNQGAHYPVLADDSGLEVAALSGRPGVRSHRYATPRAGLPQDEANRQLLLKELAGHTNRDARFTCTLALIIEGIMLTAVGTLDGTISEQPQGKTGFGYDPLFIPTGYDRTLAEMSAAEKNALSHRAVAVKELMQQLKKHALVLAKP